MTHVLFVCDSGAEVGGGHVMRSLTLAGALATEGVRASFMAPPAAARVLDAFDTLGCGRVPVEEPETPQDLARAARRTLEGGGFDAAVSDHFGLGAAEHALFRAHADTLLVIDDLADRPLAPDLLLDVSFGRGPAEYAGLTPPEAELLLGPEYALVRPEFAAARARGRALAEGAARRALISLGLTDVGGVTERVLEQLDSILGDMRLDVVTGAQAPSLPQLRERAARDPRLTLHVDTPAIAERMARADFAVGAGGSSTWERACLGLPTLTLVLADNQAPLAARLADAGLTLSVDVREPGYEPRLRDGFRRLAADAEFRRELSGKTAALCDGCGAARVAERLLARLASRAG
ncbi:MAG TPA: UDP-2,4-diacetamido-2,4,6-trideoxy-beta-L-altropyranose hydrolase [Caulobacteraceae bacterium]